MILVPLRGSGTRGDQVENARLFEEAGAAVCFIPEEPSSGKLSRLIASFAEDPERRKARGEVIIGGSASLDGAVGGEFIAREIIRRIEGGE
jgi:UDP-N-acetylglucosamine--N-acetylmuramyl-(pentapeptide) pyrophosphoryl-undecaprenol N-acetylglucosamine transferase